MVNRALPSRRLGVWAHGSAAQMPLLRLHPQPKGLPGPEGWGALAGPPSQRPTPASAYRPRLLAAAWAPEKKTDPEPGLARRGGRKGSLARAHLDAAAMAAAPRRRGVPASRTRTRSRSLLLAPRRPELPEADGAERERRSQRAGRVLREPGCPRRLAWSGSSWRASQSAVGPHSPGRRGARGRAGDSPLELEGTQEDRNPQTLSRPVHGQGVPCCPLRCQWQCGWAWRLRLLV